MNLKGCSFHTTLFNYLGYYSTQADPDIYRYANFLSNVYHNSPIAKSDKFPPTPSMVYIKLALVKKMKVSKLSADKFTHLTLQGDVDQILHVKEVIKMNDILKEDKIRLVVVEGAPGIGKSTFAWELCRQWPTMESLKHFSLVVLHRLREEAVQSATNVSDLFPYEDDPGLSSRVAEKIRRENGKDVLFVFDGFDELPAYTRNSSDSLVMKIIAGRVLYKATVLVTSRPSATADLESLFQMTISKRIEVVGFSSKEIQNYVENAFASDFETLANFKNYLSVNPAVKGMMYNPLNCAIVVEVYRETSESGKPVPHTQTQLYTVLTECLLSRYLSATGKSELSCSLSDLSHDSKLYQQLVEVGRLAFEGTQKEEVIFRQLPENCSDLGLLIEHKALFRYTERNATTFNFFHLTLQEYLSAFYISQLPDDEQKRLFKKHFKSMTVVWRFVAGLTKMQQIGWNEALIESLRYSPVSVEAHISMFAIHYFYEAQDVQSCKSVFRDYRVRFQSPYFKILSNYDLHALGYCISACNNTWIVELRSSSGVDLQMLSQGMKSVKHGGGSIDNLDLMSSKGIINGRKHLLQLPDWILQHIKSLNLKMCGIDQSGFNNLAECIGYLRSLLSLDICVNTRSYGNLVKLFHSLTKHQILQELYITDLVMSLDDVTALSKLVSESKGLKILHVGDSKEHLFRRTLSPYIEYHLLMTLLKPSSIKTLRMGLIDISVLQYMESISDNITKLSFSSTHESKEKQFSLWLWLLSLGRLKFSTKLSYILRENTSLKELELNIPLDRDEVNDILHALEFNHSLKKLMLSRLYHYFYFPPEVNLDSRISFV